MSLRFTALGPAFVYFVLPAASDLPSIILTSHLIARFYQSLFRLHLIILYLFTLMGILSIH